MLIKKIGRAKKQQETDQPATHNDSDNIKYRWKLDNFFATITLCGIGVSIAAYAVVTKGEEPLPFVRVPYYGPGQPLGPDNRAIVPFKIKIPQSHINRLYVKLNQTEDLVPPLEGGGFHSGVNTAYLSEFIEYWRTVYNWTQQEAHLNKWPQFLTEIKGLRIHFVHVKPDEAERGKTIYRILLIHGWPSSVVEFYKMIPFLRKSAKGLYGVEILVPSLPGHGFSEGPSKPGLDVLQTSLMLHELTIRLGWKDYFVHGSGLGSMVSHSLAVMLPHVVQGFHSTMCLGKGTSSFVQMALFLSKPEHYIERSNQGIKRLVKPTELLSKTASLYWYSTHADTLGVGMTDSPAFLAAHILESVSAKVLPKCKTKPDSGLGLINKNDLIDNIMIYWFTKSFSTSVRIYKETMESSSPFMLHKIYERQVKATAHCVWFENDVVYIPKYLIRKQFKREVYMTYIRDCGHYGAYQSPEIIANSILKLLNVVNIEKRK